jgi:ADP-ribose pyrophosphatase YjhB (NUDIX family)
MDAISDKQNTFFKFCPSCCSQDITYINNLKLHCKTCDFVLYHNIAAAVCVVFTFNNQILFVERNVDPDKGTLDLPGGFIDPNENAEEAACREISEELGLHITPNDLKYIGTAPNNYLFKRVPYRTLDIFYECKLESKTVMIKSKDEIKKLLWIERNKIEVNKIGFVSVRKVIGDNFINY